MKSEWLTARFFSVPAAFDIDVDRPRRIETVFLDDRRAPGPRPVDTNEPCGAHGRRRGNLHHRSSGLGARGKRHGSTPPEPVHRFTGGGEPYLGILSIQPVE